MAAGTHFLSTPKSTLSPRTSSTGSFLPGAGVMAGSRVMKSVMMGLSFHPGRRSTGD
jgi:hypothetical protein